jgi:hypothetical protein
MNRFTRFVAAGAALAVGGAGLAGCDFTEGNDVDPNAATTAPPGLLLVGGQIGQILVQEGDFARLSGIFAGQFTGSDRQYSRIDRASLNSDDFSNTWSAVYQETVAQLDLARQGFEEANNRAGTGVAKLHLALAFGQTTALFGDIPFSQALQAFEFPNPAFDPQMQVYEGVIDLLDEAIADLESLDLPDGAAVPGGIFVGNSLEAAYTARARYYLHIGDYENALASARNGISSPENSLVAPHGNATDSDANLYWAFVARFRDGYLTANNAYAVQLLAEGDDDFRGNDKTDENARLDFYYTLDRDTTTNAPVVSDVVPNTSADGAFAKSASFPVVTYAENQLILAEAALLAEDDEDTALEALNDVRAANQAQFGDDDGDLEYEPYEIEDFDTDGIANSGDDSRQNALLREILEEKYLSLIGQIEAYNDIRRTDNFIGIPGKNNGEVPQRFIYARNELNANTSAPSPIPPVGQETAVNAMIDYTGAD